MGIFSSHKGDDTKSVAESNGNTSTYFGGSGKADGPGHGHIVTDSSGNITYSREPGESHGSQNHR